MKWISVEDRLPDKNAGFGSSPSMLVTNGRYCNTAYLSEENVWRLAYDGFGLDDITHWMPLPSLPK